MDITFKNKKLTKSFNEGAQLVKIHGELRAKKIRIRMKELRAAASLMDLWPPYSGPGRCHEIGKGKRADQLSVDLDHPYRLVFVPDHDPIQRFEGGELDWSRVTAIRILGVEDTHD